MPNTSYHELETRMQTASLTSLEASRLASEAWKKSSDLWTLVNKLTTARVGKRAINLVRQEAEAASATAHRLQADAIRARMAEQEATFDWLATFNHTPEQLARMEATRAKVRETNLASLAEFEPNAPELPPDLGIEQAETDEGDDPDEALEPYDHWNDARAVAEAEAKQRKAD